MPSSPHDVSTPAPHIQRLVLADFRSYAALDLALQPGLVVLNGENGAGKTNLIEAISFLCPGRGLRRAELAECARAGGSGQWSVFAELATPDGERQLGIGVEPQDGAMVRRYRLDREPVPSLKLFADLLRIIWLTPAMDGLFSGPAGERRRFLDRLVLAVDAEQGTRVNALERALRNRNRLLEERADRRWLDAAEQELAELAVAVAAARAETVQHLVARIAPTKNDGAFPYAELHLQGDVEALIGTRPALEIEDIYRGMLRDNRNRDAAAGRTLIGPQASDLLVRHGPKQADAARSSTGEQKALLVGLILAHARLVAEVSGIVPILLLDEIAAHFDVARRGALFEKLSALGGQVFMTGADRAAFADLAGKAQMLHVEAGQVAEG
jgi:DNA replication and repair protein RecF